MKLFQEGKIAEAQKAQGELSMAGEIELKGGVPGMRVSSPTSLSVLGEAECAHKAAEAIELS